MKSITHLKLSAILTSVLLFELSAHAQTWSKISAPVDNYWQSITSSSDGTKLAAVTGYPNNGNIYVSTNSGSNWTQSSSSSAEWSGIACSADGSRLIVVAQNSLPRLSTNGGGNWTNAAVSSTGWTSVASSFDGSRLVMLGSAGIFTSTNFGATWNTNKIAGVTLGEIASSADGTRLAAVAFQGGIYTSGDSGTTWTSNSTPAPIPNFTCIASSADGSHLLAGVGGNGGSLYISADYGKNWHSNNVPRQVWSSVTSPPTAVIWPPVVIPPFLLPPISARPGFPIKYRLRVGTASRHQRMAANWPPEFLAVRFGPGKAHLLQN
jgi:photosystem II stability/assembly factor-like uncharacterized protein